MPIPLKNCCALLTSPFTKSLNFLLCLYNSAKATTTAVIAVTSRISGLAFRKLNASLIPLPVTLAVLTKPAIANLTPLVAILAVNTSPLPISLPLLITAPPSNSSDFSTDLTASFPVQTTDLPIPLPTLPIIPNSRLAPLPSTFGLIISPDKAPNTALVFPKTAIVDKVAFNARFKPKIDPANTLKVVGCLDANFPKSSNNGKAILRVVPIVLNPVEPSSLTILKKSLMSSACLATQLPIFSIESAVKLAISATGLVLLPLNELLNALTTVLTALFALSPIRLNDLSTSLPSNDLDRPDNMLLDWLKKDSVIFPERLL